MGRARYRRGFTLIELMVVVAIIGVLAAVAVPAFRAQMMRARTTEAVQTLGAIRQAEDSYYGLYSQYAGSLGWNPASIPAPNTVGSFDVAASGWEDLGVDPEGPVRFRYRVWTGGPGTRPALDGAPTSGAGAGIPGFSGAEYWFVTQAQADLDGDGTTVVFEGYSISDRVFVSRGIGGSYLETGWE
ncbi:type IV pilin protein [Sandaracinus amylolyticus]|uniref:Type IV pilus biogenesis protein PilE n=1 Tax=Sandaracinus amylolyticus TaxID=927083 RepID=A0A0F6SFG0_9BACT|nr:Type IV pilus biogenesis protein PilE [Sandaracinus amylolyticus]